MHETTLRVFSALRDRAHESEETEYYTLNQIAQDAGLSLDETAEKLDRLAVVDAVERTDDDEMAYRPRDVTVGTIADRLAALHSLPADRRERILQRLRAGDIDPSSLVAFVEALGLDGDATVQTAQDSTAGTSRPVWKRMMGYVPGTGL